MKELYTRKGQTGPRRRYYAEYGDAISGVPSFERVTLMGPRERGWERFVMRDLPGGVIKITKTPWPLGSESQGKHENIQV